jgi:hypothetical protein
MLFINNNDSIVDTWYIIISLNSSTKPIHDELVLILIENVWLKMHIFMGELKRGWMKHTHRVVSSCDVSTSYTADAKRAMFS